MISWFEQAKRVGRGLVVANAGLLLVSGTGGALAQEADQEEAAPTEDGLLLSRAVKQCRT